MTEPKIQFNDGAGYERMMGIWSGIAGGVFLDWLAPQKGLAWADIGCGNGAFTQLIVERCAPKSVKGVDPSEGQLAYARTRLASAPIELKVGDAMALPWPDNSVDVSTMALVLFFVPEPAKGLAEMVRVTRPGGIAAAYVWDMPGGGFPADAIFKEMEARGHAIPQTPRADISDMGALKALWTSQLDAVETRRIDVERGFDGFDDFWDACTNNAAIGAGLKTLPDAEVKAIKAGVRDRLGDKPRFTAFANAAKGKVR
jgi:ubiquinone/menaquinone biosynthesis C-methylase UbiE